MRTLLWPAAAVFLVAGCSTPPGGGAAAQHRPDPRPLDRVLDVTAAQSAALHRAEEQEVRTCMTARGFAYAVRPVSDARRSATPSPYGLLTESRARQNGYGLTVDRLRKRPPDPNARRLAALNDHDRRVWEAALQGAPDGPREEIALPDGPTMSVSTDSCVTAATRALYGASWERNLFTLQNLANTVVADALAHPLVRAAERKWAACMRDQGFPYENRQDPLRALEKRLTAAGTDQAALRATGREELRIAGQDAACQAESGLAERILRAQNRIEKALPPVRTSVLADVRTARRRALERAERA
ncbi:hypothetical protein [Streptomyces sp. NPDC057682]|uniref:hypothetical protein n=1 Tax=unclassified Streptomyces TaxID=2593676 RepID=UPI0036476DC6